MPDINYADLVARLRAACTPAFTLPGKAADAIEAQAVRYNELFVAYHDVCAELARLRADHQTLRDAATQVLADMRAQGVLIEWQSLLNDAIEHAAPPSADARDAVVAAERNRCAALCMRVADEARNSDQARAAGRMLANWISTGNPNDDGAAIDAAAGKGEAS